MKIVFTGAGSFTGYWIIKKIIEDGHKVYPLFEEDLSTSFGVRKERLKKISSITECFFNVNYSSDKFFKLLSDLKEIDFFCHHFFNTKNYKDKRYDIIDSLSISVGNVNRLFEVLKKINCKSFILTGSSFEKNEGGGDKILKPFSPYGLSKSLASDVFSYYCEVNNIKFSKFVIPNPFGPYEEYKFTSYLADLWLKEEIPLIKSPDYIRDNIPVDLLAMAYSNMISDISVGKDIKKINPSGYIESNIKFVERMSKEISKRLSIKCLFKTENQTDFSEPLSRYNTDNMFKKFPDYSEKLFWDHLSSYYEEVFKYKKYAN